MSAIAASGLSKSFGGAFGLGASKIALAGVDLVVPEGAAFGLIGLNGAGKTTFIKAMLAVVRPSSGSIRVLGGDPEDPAIRAQIGYLPERLYLAPSWNARQILASTARLRRIPRARVEGEIDRQLTRVGLSPEDARRKVGGYSKGMRQRLGLAGALLGSPRLLVLDEPTDGVDPLGRGEIRQILTEERARGATLFLNSHLLSETEKVCDRIGILHAGKVLVQGTVEALAGRDDRWIVRLDPGGVTDASVLVPLGFELAGEHRFVIDGKKAAEMNLAIDAARALGAIVTHLERDTKDLEQLLREAVSR